jgi:hypothetical protein
MCAPAQELPVETATDSPAMTHIPTSGRSVHTAGVERLNVGADASTVLSALFPKGPAVSNAKVQQLLDELQVEPSIAKVIERYQVDHHIGWDAVVSTSKLSSALFCYAAVRLLCPANVVETGCGAGWFSTLVLLALDKNRRGHLWTIDLPARKGRFGMDWGLPRGADPGFLVPSSLKDRWTLLVGPIERELSSLLDQIEVVDMFVQDSERTYCHMMWEYCSVWPHLRSNGLLIADGITWNPSFLHFTLGIERSIVTHCSNPNMGAVVK